MRIVLLTATLFGKLHKLYIYIYIYFIIILHYNYVFFVGVFVSCFGSFSGAEFYIGASRNYRGITSSLWLYITTSSSSPVGYTVEQNTGVITTGNVTNISPAIVSLPTSLAVSDSSYSNRDKGIHIYSDSVQSISVLLINHQIFTIGDYLAFPYQEYQINQYQYYAVSTGTQATNGLSEVLLVGNKDNTTVTIIPTQTITVPQDIQSSGSPGMTVTAGTPFTVTLHKMQTFLFGAVTADISGTSIVSDKPLTVISGHECGNVPSNVAACQHITEQIPPTVTWGKQFLLTPYANRPGQYYKIVAAENNTTMNYTCSDVGVSTINLSSPGDVSNLQFSNNNAYCSLVSNKPVLVTQLGPGQHLGTGFGDPVISIISSINQYLESFTFISPDISDFTVHYVNIASTTNDTVLLDGQPLSLTWNNIYDSDNNIMGYGTQVPITNPTSHTITTQSNKTFSILVYGFGSFAGYSYGVGNLESKRCLYICY